MPAHNDEVCPSCLACACERAIPFEKDIGKAIVACNEVFADFLHTHGVFYVLVMFKMEKDEITALNTRCMSCSRDAQETRWEEAHETRIESRCAKSGHAN